MYLYGFSRFYGNDKVCNVVFSKGISSYHPGDLLESGNEFFLVLGEHVAFSEQYTYSDHLPLSMKHHHFLSESTLQLLHYMVETYYTTYSSVIKLFLPADIEKVIKYQSKKISSS